MDKEQLDAIRARCEAATPGPWEWDGSRRHMLNAPFRGRDKSRVSDGSVIVMMSGAARRGMSDDNAEFIAASRADIPALMGYVEELERHIKKINATNNQDDGFFYFTEREESK